MTDTYELELIPKCFWAAMEKTPECLTLRSAIADYLEEQGDTDGAECLRWSIAKRRRPHSMDTIDTSHVAWSWEFRPTTAHTELPPQLRWRINHGPDCIQLKTIEPCKSYPWTTAFMRLMWVWKMELVPEERTECWEWEPKE